MAKKILQTLLLVTLLCASVLAAGKERNKNRADERRVIDDDDVGMMGKEFRSRQVIQVWQKAFRMKLSRDKMKDLHRELVRIDTMYHKAKKDGTRKDSDNDVQRSDNAEMMVDRQLRETMRKYGMGQGGKMDENMKVPITEDQPFSDRKIAQLWIKAQKSKMFTDEELSDLQEELSGHQDKLDNFNSLMEEIHGPDGAKSNSAKRFDNKDPGEIRDIRAKEMELKLQHREISREFQRIAVKTMPEDQRGPFVENRVITLWQEAKKQNFSAEDMEAIEEELKAFESRILEHEEAHKESLEADMAQRDPTNKPKGPKDRSMYERAKELGMSVHEKMRDLRQRISQGGKWNEEL